MSYLTHVVLVTDCDSDDGPEPLNKLNDFLAKNNNGQKLEPLYICDHTPKWPQPGGSKVFCEGVYAACFNYLRLDDLINEFPTLGWEDENYLGANTVLLYRDEGDDEWHAILGDGTPAQHRTPTKKEDIQADKIAQKLLSDMFGVLQVWGNLETKPPELIEMMSKIASSYATYMRAIERIYRR